MQHNYYGFLDLGISYVQRCVGIVTLLYLADNLQVIYFGHFGPHAYGRIHVNWYNWNVITANRRTVYNALDFVIIR